MFSVMVSYTDSHFSFFLLNECQLFFCGSFSVGSESSMPEDRRQASSAGMQRSIPHGYH